MKLGFVGGRQGGGDPRGVRGPIKLFSDTAGCTGFVGEISGIPQIPASGRDAVKLRDPDILVRPYDRFRGQDVFLYVRLPSQVNHNTEGDAGLPGCAHQSFAGSSRSCQPRVSYSRSDRKDRPWVPITARLLADLMGLAGAGALFTLDLQADRIQWSCSVP